MWQPQYRITDDIATKLTDMARIREKITVATLLPTREALLRRKAVVKMAHTSTSIEGNQLQEYQVQELIAGKKVDAEAQQIKEVKNYLTALKLIDTLSQQKVLKTTDILRVHRSVIDGLVDSDKTGIFRKRMVYVVRVGELVRERLIYTAPPPQDVPALITELLEWISKAKNIHPILRAGLLHYQCTSIHPFTDGNGRVARLLALLHLYQSGWGFRKLLVLEDYYNNNRDAYYHALDTGKTYKEREGVDLTSWLTYFVDGFWEETVRIHEQILRLQTGGKKIATEARLNKTELTIIDFVVTTGRIRSDDVTHILEIPKRTAQAKLQKLEKLQMLKKQGAGPSTYYILNTEI